MSAINNISKLFLTIRWPWSPIIKTIEFWKYPKYFKRFNESAKESSYSSILLELPCVKPVKKLNAKCEDFENFVANL